MEDKKGEITDILLEWTAGDASALERLMPLVFDELRRIAKGYLDHERANHTLQPTAVVHELYLRLVDRRRVSWRNRAHFFGATAKTMRRILVDHARTHLAGKRGAGVKPQQLDEYLDKALERDQQLVDLDDALNDLARIHPRQARVVELNYFAGLTYKEIGEVLGVSSETPKRDFRAARLWLLEALSDAETLEEPEERKDGENGKDEDET